jgi:hypothetical protein
VIDPMDAPMKPWGSTDVYVVEPGTEIEGPFGKKITVTDDLSVSNDGKMYVTQKNFDLLKAKVEVKEKR